MSCFINNTCTSSRFRKAYAAYSNALNLQYGNCTSRSAYNSSVRYNLHNCVHQYGFIKKVQIEQPSKPKLVKRYY